MHLLLLWAATLAATTVVDESTPPQPVPNWESVEEAIRDALPRLVVKRVTPILEEALRRGDYPSAIRALRYKIRYETAPGGRWPERRIRALEKAIGRMPEPMRPILHLAAAAWYAEYDNRCSWWSRRSFSSWRWRSALRGTTAEPTKRFAGRPAPFRDRSAMRGAAG